MFRHRYAAFVAAAAALYVLAFALSTSVLIQTKGVSKDAGWTWNCTSGTCLVESIATHGPAKGVLSPGDILVAVNGDARASAAGPRAWLQCVNPGELYRMTVSRSGESRSYGLRMGQTKPQRQAVFMAVCDLLISIPFVLMALMVGLAKPDERVARYGSAAGLLLALFLSASAIGFVSPLLRGWPIWCYTLLKSTFPFQFLFALRFFATLPRSLRNRRDWIVLDRLLTVVAMLTWLILLPQRVVPHLDLEWRLSYLAGLDLWERPELWNVHLRYAVEFFFLLAIAFVCERSVRLERNPAERVRLRWVYLGAVIGLTPVTAFAFALSVGTAFGLMPKETVSELMSFGSLASLPSAIIPVTVAYAILRHRVLGIAFVVRRMFQIVLAAPGLRIAIALPITALLVQALRDPSVPLDQFLMERQVLFYLLVAAFLVREFRKPLLGFLDRGFFQAYSNRERILRETQAEIVASETLDQAGELAATRIQEALSPTSIVVLFRGLQTGWLEVRGGTVAGVSGSEEEGLEPDWEKIAARACGTGPVPLQKVSTIMDASELDWLERHDITLMVPVRTREDSPLAGLFLLGNKESGEAYSFVDMDLLQSTAIQAAAVCERLKLAQAREDAIRAKARAEEASRMKGEFLANMSHEIRTPMNGIVGIVGLLADSPLTSEQQEYVQMIRMSSETLLKVINGILDFSKIEAGRLEFEAIEFDIVAAVEDAVRMCATAAREKRLELNLTFGEKVPSRVVGDPARIQQVLNNFLANAIKFTPQGEVAVAVECEENNGETAAIRFSVRDTGIGIPVPAQHRLFQSFSQADASTTRRFGGTGLGLAISRQLVELMGGQIGFESEVNTGSVFWFALSLPVAPNQKPEPDGPSDLTARRVLVAVENITTKQLLSRTLRDHGAAVEEAGYLEKAVGLLRDSRSFDAAVIDADLPDDGCEEILARIRSMPRLIPAIVLASHGAPQVSDAIGLRIVYKPVRWRSLVTTLACLLDPTPTLVEKADRPVRILLAEDNPVNLRVAQLLLERLGCGVAVAADGEEAVREALHTAYDLVLMDCQMPRMDGLEATRRIRERERGRRTPIVALTANAVPEDRERCLAAEMDGFLSKPLTIRDLEDVLNRWVRRSDRRATGR